MTGLQTARLPMGDALVWRDKAKPSQLYFVETMCAERHIKIGVASNVRARMGKMQMDCPYTLRLIKRVADSAHLEEELHARFSGQRLGGEWFRRTPELVAFIDGLDGSPFLETDTNTKETQPKRWNPFPENENTVRTTVIRQGVRPSSFPALLRWRGERWGTTAKTFSP